MMIEPHQDLGHAHLATVLVVEDEIFVREPIAEYLRDCGYHVLEAGDAREAISLLQAGHDADVVFSDVRMPGDMDGFALAQWLRQNYPSVSILLTSGFYTRRAGDEAPLEDVKLIGKPYTQAQVLHRIRRLLHEDD